jgi:hypothetical protein
VPEKRSKQRTAVPALTAARVLFQHDRRCCVCRERKPVQIHHVDENPTHHDEHNLAVLCLDCHNETQLVGGFHRKLDADQVRLYRDDWLEQVRRNRLTEPMAPIAANADPDTRIRVTAARLEIAKRKGDLVAVARLYHAIGDIQLRDTYIDRALAKPHQAWEEFWLRGLQGRIDLLSPQTVQDVLSTTDWTARAGALADLGQIDEAAVELLEGILDSVRNKRYFTAAYYIKYGLLERLLAPLFEKRLTEALESGDLWWQMRVYEELGWTHEKTQLLLAHESEIMESGFLPFIRELAEAKGDDSLLLESEKQMAEAGARAWAMPTSSATTRARRRRSTKKAPAARNGED